MQTIAQVKSDAVKVLATSLGLVVSLALNSALIQTFDLLPLNRTNKVANAWLYVLVVGTLVVVTVHCLLGRPAAPPAPAVASRPQGGNYFAVPWASRSGGGYEAEAARACTGKPALIAARDHG